VEISIIINKIIQKDYESSLEMGEELWGEVLKKCYTKTYPDDVVWVVPMNGTPHWTAVKKLKSPVKDPWGVKVDEDRVVAEYGEMIGLAEEGMVYKSISTKEELMKKKYKFFLLSQEGVDKVVSGVGQYVRLDVDDCSVPEIGTFFVCDVRKDSPSEKWNKKVEELNKRAEKIAKEREREEEAEFLREVSEMAEEYAIEVDIKTPKQTGGSHFLIYFPYFGVSLRIWNSYGEMNKIENVLRKLKKWREFLAERKRIREGKSPLFTYGDVEFYPKGNEIRIPKRLFPHVIEKGGSHIKKLSDLLGRRIKLVEDNSIYIPVRKSGIYYIWMEDPTKKEIW